VKGRGLLSGEEAKQLGAAIYWGGPLNVA
jgi:hypothetical protein